jgi:hypothetical protein
MQFQAFHHEDLQEVGVCFGGDYRPVAFDGRIIDKF